MTDGFVRAERKTDVAHELARDEFRHLMALSGSVLWGVTSGQTLRPLPTRTSSRVFRVFRAA